MAKESVILVKKRVFRQFLKHRFIFEGLRHW